MTSPPATSARRPPASAASLTDRCAGRLRAQRLLELQREAHRKAPLQQQGHGGLVDVPEARLLREVECSAPVVCHLAFEGSPLDDDMDEHLARLAHLHLGTRFLRAPITLRSTLHLKLRTPPGPGAPPALPACSQDPASRQGTAA